MQARFILMAGSSTLNSELNQAYCSRGSGTRCPEHRPADVALHSGVSVDVSSNVWLRHPPPCTRAPEKPSGCLPQLHGMATTRGPKGSPLQVPGPQGTKNDGPWTCCFRNKVYLCLVLWSSGYAILQMGLQIYNSPASQHTAGLSSSRGLHSNKCL